MNFKKILIVFLKMNSRAINQKTNQYYHGSNKKGKNGYNQKNSKNSR